jgi:hypothetical protein
VGDAHDYCRRGGDCPGSSVYVFDDTSGGITCCDCRLTPARRFNAATEAAMIEHLREHRSAGDHVPERLFAAPTD